MYKYSATQNSSVSQPQLVENVVNGLPVVRFDETKTNYLNSNFYFDVAFDKTVFVVATSRDDTSGVVMSTAPNRFRFEVAGSTSAVTYRLVVGSGTVVTFHLQRNASARKFYNDNAFHILSSVSGNLSATPYFDGFAATPQNFDATSTGGNFVIGTLGTGTNTNQLFHGDIAEIIVYDRMLTTEERLSVQNYLKKKYDLKQV